MKKTLILLLIVSAAARASDTRQVDSLLSQLFASTHLRTLVLLSCLCTQAVAQSSTDNCTLPPYTFSNSQTIGWAAWQMGSGAFAIISVISSFLAPWFYWRKIERDIAKSLEEQNAVLRAENELMDANIHYCRHIESEIARRLRRRG